MKMNEMHGEGMFFSLVTCRYNNREVETRISNYMEGSGSYGRPVGHRRLSHLGMKRMKKLIDFYIIHPTEKT